jgi:hypothetical protein
MDVRLVLLISKAVRTDVKVSLEQFLASVAMKIDIREFLVAKFAKVIVAERVNMVSKRIIVCIWKLSLPHFLITIVCLPGNFFQGRQNTFGDLVGRWTFLLFIGFNGTKAAERFVYLVNKMRSYL